MNWYQLKSAIAAATGVSHDALHIFTEIALQILVAVVLRVRLSSPWPWLVVLGLEGVNEWFDLGVETWPDQSRQFGETLKDIMLTMAVPTALLILSRWAPGLFAPNRDDVEEASKPDDAPAAPVAAPETP